MGKIHAGVVHVAQFVLPKNKAYVGYIDYIMREASQRNLAKSAYTIAGLKEAVQKYNPYLDYMANPKKTGELFTAEKDFLTKDEKERVKSLYELAQENGSPMWQSVFSFDNEWLEKQGVYDSNTNFINDKAVMKAIRKSVSVFLSEMDMQSTGLWTGAIHYNTDNIHVHVAIVEPIPTRERIDKGKNKGEYKAYIPKTALAPIRREVVKELMQDKETNKTITKIARESILGKARENPFSLDGRFVQDFMNIYEQLPDDSRKWHYNMEVTKHVRPLLDDMTKRYIDEEHSTEFKELVKLIEHQDEAYKEAYGIGKEEKNNFGENRVQLLYANIGNAILSQMREYRRTEKQEAFAKKMKERKIKYNVKGALWEAKGVGYNLQKSMQAIQKSMRSEYMKWVNEREHEMLQYEIERAGGEEK